MSMITNQNNLDSINQYWCLSCNLVNIIKLQHQELFLANTWIGRRHSSNRGLIMGEVLQLCAASEREFDGQKDQSHLRWTRTGQDPTGCWLGQG